MVRELNRRDWETLGAHKLRVRSESWLGKRGEMTEVKKKMERKEESTRRADHANAIKRTNGGAVALSIKALRKIAKSGHGFAHRPPRVCNQLSKSAAARRRYTRRRI